MKKTLSILLSVLMIFSVFGSMNVSVFAMETINNADIFNNSKSTQNVNPAVGRKPCFDFNTTSDSHTFVYTDYNNRPFINGVSWYDETSMRYLSESDSFTAGHAYTLTVALASDDGYVFATSEGRVSTAIRFSVDGEEIDGTYYFGYKNADVTEIDGAIGNQILASATFTCEEPVLIETASINVAVPAIGETASAASKNYNTYSFESSKYDIDASGDSQYINNLVKWYCVTDGYTLSAADKFEAGKVYRAYVTIAAKDGYEFKVDGDSQPDITVSFYSSDATVILTDGKDASRYIKAYADYSLIDKVNVVEMSVDLDYVSGGTPVFFANTEEPSKYTKSDYFTSSVCENGVCYYDETAGSYVDKIGSWFIAGHLYKLTVAVTCTDLYEFEGLNVIKGTVNGVSATVSCTSPFGEYIKGTYFFTVDLGVCPYNINSCSVVGISDTYKYTYSGTQKKAVQEVYDGYEKLVYGKDYTVTYKNNINAGTATYTIKGIGNYGGEWTGTFRILRKALSKSGKVLISADKYTYDGKVHKPTVKVYDGSKLLKNNTDYTLTYSSLTPRAVGKYTVRVSYKGNYSGGKTVTYTILPKGTALLKTAAAGKSYITPQWNKQTKGTTGYQIMYSTSPGFKSGNKTVTVTSNKTTVKKITGLKKNTKYYFKIRTYKDVKVSGRTTKYYSSWSPVKTFKTTKR